MGEGLKRVARQCGGMRVSARGETVDYVPVKSAVAAQREINQRVADGWCYIGTTEDQEFLQFKIATSAAEDQ